MRLLLRVLKHSGSLYGAAAQPSQAVTSRPQTLLPRMPNPARAAPPRRRAGNWALVVRRDIFYKVSGAVRIVPLLAQQALLAKVAIALDGAAACRAAEVASLLQAAQVAQQPLLPLLNATLLQQYQGGQGAWARGAKLGRPCYSVPCRGSPVLLYR